MPVTASTKSKKTKKKKGAFAGMRLQTFSFTFYGKEMKVAVGIFRRFAEIVVGKKYGTLTKCPDKKLSKLIGSSQKQQLLKDSLDNYLNEGKYPIKSTRTNGRWVFIIYDHGDFYRLGGVRLSYPKIKLGSRVVYVSGHALDRVVERWPKLNKGKEIKNPLRMLQDIASKASKETLTRKAKMRRLLSNRGREAQYWRNGPWRLVIEEGQDGPTITTIEINRF